MASMKVTGQAKYPALYVSARDTGERFGLHYVEPGCRPVPLDWEKHKSQKTVPPLREEETDQPSTLQVSLLPVVFHHPAAPASSAAPSEGNISQEIDVARVLVSLSAETCAFPPTEKLVEPSHWFATLKKKYTSSERDLLSTSPLPLTASPVLHAQDPLKTGGRIFVLDHGRWTQPMRDAIDGLLAKHHGKKDMLKQVDADYAALVHRSCKDPNRSPSSNHKAAYLSLCETPCQANKHQLLLEHQPREAVGDVVGNV
ncbi:uncharacterized protein LOC127621732 [Xyrauchen texanus]|uniref:uncharacterized protein LOC127621732 n=1 Tax=Xyrauchen texanus TaxID=154827 RepID=UPI002241DE39|nr:uncharacterized protein LOC127621732 [Xyrauchen texanus]